MERAYRWTGWLSGVALAAYAGWGMTMMPWFIRAFLGTVGTGLLLSWIIERFEERRSSKLMRSRKACCLVLFAAPILLLVVGGIGSLLQMW
jgi:hypothetical protein